MSSRRLRGGNGFEGAGVSAASSSATTLTSGGSANTKGAYVELLASTAYPSCGVVLTVGLASNANAHAVGYLPRLY